MRALARPRRLPAALRLAPLLMILLAAGFEARASESATPSDAALCDEAARHAAAEAGMPLEILRAISLAETGGGLGGRLRPWPWTTNVEGVGKWHPTRAAAIAHIRKRHAEGARSYDVGCFQINRRWHGEAFNSLEEMFDPLAGARYAARFLTALHEEAGDWNRAAGWYHSRTPALAGKYRARVQRILAALPDAPAAAGMVFGTGRAPAAARPAAPPAPSPGGVRLAFGGAQDGGALLRRALPLIVALVAGQGGGGSGAALGQDSPPPETPPARPLFD
ncbi:lytic transglycosylase domain-containing protein [Rhodovulum sp. DZ06]|uniref:lytic transglycosylase domain-containing protein n=1 Tax=Rhodovulum sp. DZ06 TaxID=3425126 RepID=UPI003D329E64